MFDFGRKQKIIALIKEVEQEIDKAEDYAIDAGAYASAGTSPHEADYKQAAAHAKKHFDKATRCLEKVENEVSGLKNPPPELINQIKELRECMSQITENLENANAKEAEKLKFNNYKKLCKGILGIISCIK